MLCTIGIGPPRAGSGPLVSLRPISAAAAVTRGHGSVISQFNLVWEVVCLHLRLLFEGVASDRLESLVHVDGLFCAGLKVWDIAFALTPRLGSFRCHLSVLQVDFVAEHYKGEVLRVSWAGLNEKLVPPAVQGFEGVGRCDVVHQHAAVRSTVKSHTQRLEALLSCRVPDLHCHQPVIHHHLLGKKICTDCGFILIAELLIDILVHQRGLPNTRIPKNDHLQEHLFTRSHPCGLNCAF